jgi:hypothetical protein
MRQRSRVPRLRAARPPLLAPGRRCCCPPGPGAARPKPLHLHPSKARARSIATVAARSPARPQARSWTCHRASHPLSWRHCSTACCRMRRRCLTRSMWRSRWVGALSERDSRAEGVRFTGRSQERCTAAAARLARARPPARQPPPDFATPLPLAQELAGELGAHLLKAKISVERALRITYMPQAVSPPLPGGRAMGARWAERTAPGRSGAGAKRRRGSGGGALRPAAECSKGCQPQGRAAAPAKPSPPPCRAARLGPWAGVPSAPRRALHGQHARPLRGCPHRQFQP